MNTISKTMNEMMNRRISMIICVTTDVILSEKPAEMMNIDHVHIMNSIIEKSGDSEIKKREDIYRLALNEVVKRLEAANISYEIHSDKNTLKFEEMMPALFEILKEESENGSHVSINISGSTPEFAAAASIAAMMYKDNCDLFSVGTKNGYWNKTLDELKDFYTDEETGRLVGKARDITEPFMISGFKIEQPDERLLKQLKIFGTIPIEKRTNSNVIRNIIKQGLWKPSKYYRNGDTFTKETSIELEEKNTENNLKYNPEYKERKNNEAVTYQRYMIRKWEEQGLIYKNSKETGNKYDLTPKARDYLNMFCSDKIFKIEEKELDIRR